MSKRISQNENHAERDRVTRQLQAVWEQWEPERPELLVRFITSKERDAYAAA